MNDAPSVAVIGGYVMDHVMVVSGQLVKGTGNPVRCTRRPGGAGRNIAIALAGAGCRPRPLGRLGDDDAGDIVASDLREAGIDISHMNRSGATTVVTVIIENAERTFLIPDGDTTRTSPIADLLTDTTLEDINALHISGHVLARDPKPDLTARRLHELRQRGIHLSTESPDLQEITGDPQDYREILRHSRFHTLFANHEEATALGALPRPSQHRRLSSNDVGLADISVITAAQHATTVVVGGSHAAMTVEVPPVSDVTDTTGAGDAFAAGYLAALLASPREVAALECSAMRIHSKQIRHAVEAGHLHASRLLRHRTSSQRVLDEITP
jgi:sugar/nucleoside kinase (ribokinase family)